MKPALVFYKVNKTLGGAQIVRQVLRSAVLDGADKIGVALSQQAIVLAMEAAILCLVKNQGDFEARGGLNGKT